MIDLKKTVGNGLNTLAMVAPKSTGRITLDLFCRPIKGRHYNNKETAFLEEATWKTLYFDEKTIQCYIWGTGEKTVFLAHGFNSNAARWRLMATVLLNAGYQVIAMDAPAHGKSDWSRINGILYAQTFAVAIQHFKPDYIVGHSFAGVAFCYYFTKMNALPVKKMVMMGVPNELMDVTNIFFRELRLKSRVQNAYLAAFEEKFGFDVDYFTLSKMIPEINIPGLVIHDEQDDITSFKGAKELYEHWEGAQFFGTNGLGHSLQGRSVYGRVVEFLREI